MVRNRKETTEKSKKKPGLSTQIFIALLAGALLGVVIHYWIVLRTLHTIRFDSCSGFAWNNQHLHPSTDYSVSPRRCHDSVSTSLPQVVPEY